MISEMQSKMLKSLVENHELCVNTCSYFEGTNEIAKKEMEVSRKKLMDAIDSITSTRSVEEIQARIDNLKTKLGYSR